MPLSPTSPQLALINELPRNVEVLRESPLSVHRNLRPHTSVNAEIVGIPAK
ncbi:hypothetical protein PVK06_023185 [Gossypium arboreum]|uniref:Uncharacterized protein n=1 Tax=Gossypium arboreum TaxID=29729 RepID=A0ABR0PAL5_GOSAR|nr:hypothetical protein PVK06_023185 [Gossypium arboreum]